VHKTPIQALSKRDHKLDASHKTAFTFIFNPTQGKLVQHTDIRYVFSDSETSCM